jgi:hypothetical protein
MISKQKKTKKSKGSIEAGEQILQSDLSGVRGHVAGTRHAWQDTAPGARANRPDTVIRHDMA